MIARAAIVRTTSKSSVGATKMRATISLSPTYGLIRATSSAESQLMMAPSASSPASRSMPGRRAATRMVRLHLGHEAEPEALDLEGVVALGDLLAR